MWEHGIIMLEMHRAKILNSGNPQIKLILHWSIFADPHRHNFQMLPSSTTMPHSTSHEAHNHALVQPKNIQVMGHGGKHMISSKEVMVDLKCSPLSNSQHMVHHLQAHLECLQHHLDTIQSFGRPLRPLLHKDNFPAHLEDHPFTSQWNDFSCMRNHRRWMLPGLRICPYHRRYSKTNMMQIIRAMVCQTWAGPKAKP